MPYVDGFLVAVPDERMADYRKLARKAGKIWKEYGALAYVECVEDDVPHGKTTSFPRAVKRKEGETVIFAYIVYKSRRQRDSINNKVMQDPRLADMDPKTVPFDARRLIFGGFKTFVDL